MLNISMLSPGAIKLNGVVDYYVDFVVNLHLKDRSVWDKFVKVFVDRADSEDCGWRGEYWGKMMRGACTCYYYTQDYELYNVLTYAVENLLNAQDEYGRISSFSIKREFRYWDTWCRKYVITGLLHYYDICTNQNLKARIIDALRKHIDYIISKLGREEGKVDITLTSEVFGGVNSCSILETIINFYNRTKEQKYLDFAEYIISTGGSANGSLIDAVNDKTLIPSKYPVQKAYEMISFFEGLLEYYKISGDTKYLDTVLNFIDAIQKNEITVIGCAGCYSEDFNNARYTQTEKVELPTQETCVTVTWMRLLAKAFLITGNAKYIESFEISSLNALYGSVNVNKLQLKRKVTFVDVGVFAFDSYSPLIDDVRNKGMAGLRDFADGGVYGCCACIGSVAVALVPLMTVLKDGDSAYVNAYYEGKFSVDENLSFTIQGNYPVDDSVLITITNACEKERTIKLRVPTWCDDFVVKTGGVIKDLGEYKSVSKVWKKGDVIEVQIKKGIKAFVVNGYTSYSYGPIVLARDDKKEQVAGNLSCVNFDLDKATFNRVPEKAQEMVRFEVYAENEKIILTDYASCGKLWNEENKLSVWFRKAQR